MFTSIYSYTNHLIRGASHLLFPKACWFCGTAQPPEGRAFCDECHIALITESDKVCPWCAMSIGPFVNVDKGCTWCRPRKLAFSGAVRLGTYDGIRKTIVLRMKHKTGEALAEVVGRIWAKESSRRLREWEPEIVVPIPLHWRRRLRRGYNQAETLARAIAQGLGVVCWSRCLRRDRNTPRQTTRNTPLDRLMNMKNAFEHRSSHLVKGRRIVLVDDVMTTGATMNEAATTLKDAGAERVIVAVLTRATRDSS
ncbi:MAG: ComF family protein [Gemmataceae bacterium]